MTVACSDPVAAEVDEIQYKLDDGPCLHAMRDGHAVRIEDTTRRKDTGVKARWPEFEAQAASHGIRSCLALPLTAGGRSIGAINLYARTASAFGTAKARRAENFAENASGALTLALRLSSQVLLIEQLRSSCYLAGRPEKASAGRRWDVLVRQPVGHRAEPGLARAQVPMGSKFSWHRDIHRRADHRRPCGRALKLRSRYLMPSPGSARDRFSPEGSA
jgi:hypothetical protein